MAILRVIDFFLFEITFLYLQHFILEPVGKPFKPSSLPSGIHLSPIMSSARPQVARQHNTTTTTSSCSTKPLLAATTPLLKKNGLNCLQTQGSNRGSLQRQHVGTLQHIPAKPKSVQIPKQVLHSVMPATTVSNATTSLSSAFSSGCQMKISNVGSLVNSTQTVPTHSGLIKNPNDPNVTGIISVGSRVFQKARNELLHSTACLGVTRDTRLNQSATSVSMMSPLSSQPLPICVSRPSLATRNPRRMLDMAADINPHHHGFITNHNVRNIIVNRNLDPDTASENPFTPAKHFRQDPRVPSAHPFYSELPWDESLRRMTQTTAGSFTPWFLDETYQDGRSGGDCFISPQMLDSLQNDIPSARIQCGCESQTTCSAIPEEELSLISDDDATSLSSYSALIPKLNEHGRAPAPEISDRQPVNLLMIPDPNGKKALVPRGPDLKLFERFLSDLDSDMVHSENGKADWLEPPSDCCARLEENN